MNGAKKLGGSLPVSKTALISLSQFMPTHPARTEKKFIRVKLQRDKTFKPVLVWHVQKWWVNTSEGTYFAIFKNNDGTWSHVNNYQRRYSSIREVIQEWLSADREARERAIANYRKTKKTEQCYAI
jgi:hypothetical protein